MQGDDSPPPICPAHGSCHLHAEGRSEPHNQTDGGSDATMGSLAGITYDRVVEVICVTGRFGR